MRVRRRQWGDFPMYVWPLVLVLALQAVYLVVEIAFNAALLNVASGSVGGRDALDSLETFGRIISGVGLGLLVFANRMSQPLLAQFTPGAIRFRAFGYALLIFPVTIVGMWNLQSYLVDDVIVDQASDEERFAASYVQYVSPALRQGVLGIDQLPLTSVDLDRPETKTLLTLLLPVMMHNETLVGRLQEEAPDMIKFLSHRAALERLDDHFADYEQAMIHIGEAYDLYKTMVAEAGKEVEAAYSETRYHDASYRKLVQGMTKYYNAYQKQERKTWMKFGNYIRSSMNSFYGQCKRALDPVVGAIFRMGQSCLLQRDNPMTSEIIFAERTGHKPSFKRFCPGGFSKSTCIEKSETLAVAKRTFANMPAGKKAQFLRESSTYPFNRYLDGIPVGLSVAEFFQQPKVRRELSMPRTPGLNDEDFGVRRHADGTVTLEPDGYLRKRIRHEASIKLANRFMLEVSKQQPGVRVQTPNAMIPPEGLGGRLGVSKSEFLQLPFVKAMAGLSDTNRALVEGFSREDFFNEHLLPSTLDRVNATLSDLPMSMADIESKPDATNTALRAIYVPAIALSLSLFFTLTNAVSLLAGLVYLALVFVPAIGDRVSSMMVKLVRWVGLSAILALPVLVVPNSLVQSDVLNSAARQANLSWAQQPLHWVLSVQPLVYPVGNEVLGLKARVGLPGFYDAQADQVSTETTDKVDDVSLNTALSVRALQRKLKSEGHYRGAVDGIIGPMTTKAIKRFQRAESLPVTGYQDSLTIKSLLAR